MKKLLISLGLMFTVLISTGSVFAESQKVSDSSYYNTGHPDNGYAILEGYKDTTHGLLNGDRLTKKGYGKVGVVGEKKSTPRSATADIQFLLNGVLKKSDTLKI